MFYVLGPPPHGSYIKCMVVYRRPEHYKDVVERCVNHITQSNDGHPAPKHIVRCPNRATKYVTCPYTGRHAIAFPVREFEGNASHVFNRLKLKWVHV